MPLRWMELIFNVQSSVAHRKSAPKRNFHSVWVASPTVGRSAEKALLRVQLEGRSQKAGGDSALGLTSDTSPKDQNEEPQLGHPEGFLSSGLWPPKDSSAAISPAAGSPLTNCVTLDGSSASLGPSFLFSHWSRPDYPPERIHWDMLAWKK